MTRPIISRLEPMADESFMGFLARAAVVNEMGPLRNILIALGLPTNGFSQILAEARADTDLAEALQVPTAWLLNATATREKGAGPEEICFHGRSLPVHQILRAGRRFSPGALRVSPHNRYYWDVHGISFDFDTFELLQDTCHYCDHPLTLLGRVPLTLCNTCLSDLTQAPPREVHPKDRASLELVADLFSDDELRHQRLKMQLHPSFRHLNLGVVYQLIGAFGQACQMPTDLRGRSLAYPYALIEGVKIITNFPHYLQERLAGTSEFVVPKFFKRIRLIAARGLTTQAVEAMEIALQSVREHMEPGLKARSLKMTALNQMGVKQAASELGLPASKARKLVDQRVLKGTPIHSGERKHDAIHREDVLALDKLLNDKIAFRNITGKYAAANSNRAIGE